MKLKLRLTFLSKKVLTETRKKNLFRINSAPSFIGFEQNTFSS